MVIDLNQVKFAYPQAPQKLILNVNHWSVEPGQHVFIQGPSGCGKSTLLNLLGGLLVSQAGQVEVLGNTLNQLSHRKRDQFRAKHIGYVFQGFNLIPYLDAITNIELAAYFCKGTSSEDLHKRIQTLLLALNISETHWQTPCTMLSQGQQQRIAIARALINHPPLLIADEPTSSLDQDNRDTFISQLIAIAQKHETTLIFVSHDQSLAKHFNRVESLTQINQAGND